MGGEEATSSAAAAAAANESTNDSSSTPLDKVTQLQELFDQLALGMFNALRLLPPSQDPSSTDDTMDIDQENISKIKQLSTGVLDTVNSIDELIDTLPGLSTSEKEQFQELSRLQQCSNEEAERLQAAASQVQEWVEASRSSLRVIADDKLQQLRS